MNLRLNLEIDETTRALLIATAAVAGAIGVWIGWAFVPAEAFTTAMPTSSTAHGSLLAYRPMTLGMPLLTAALLGVAVWKIVSVATETPADGDVIQQWVDEERERVEARREVEEPVMRARSRAPAAAAALRDGATVEDALDRAGLDDEAARDVLRPALEDLQRSTDDKEGSR